MGNAGIVAAVLGLIVCIGMAALSVYITITPNSNPEIRAKFAGMVFLLISVGIGVGMVLIISRVPAGTYFDAVGVVAAICVAGLVKFGRR